MRQDETAADSTHENEQGENTESYGYHSRARWMRSALRLRSRNSSGKLTWTLRS